MTARLPGILALALVGLLLTELAVYGWIAWRHAGFWSATGWFVQSFCGG